MKKSIIALIVVLGLAVGGLVVVKSQGGWLGALGLIMHGSSDAGWLAERSIDFLEDLQFKDFDTASTYHLPEAQEARDIPAAIQKAFQVRHEILDIKKYEVMEVDLDRSKTRARVRMMIWYHLLGDQDMRENAKSHRTLEMILYWFKDSKGEWTMELESSLRS